MTAKLAIQRQGVSKAVTHEEFVRLAGEAAQNAQGLRPLAGHVRRLHRAIRTLQEDDNAFCYIAEVIQQARGDRTDTFAFMNRVKTYYHRDRKARGDSPVARGPRRTDESMARSANKPGSNAEMPERHVPRANAEGNTLQKCIESQSVSGESAVASDPSPAMPALVVQDGKSSSAGDLRALTAALHNRRGRRRIAAGG